LSLKNIIILGGGYGCHEILPLISAINSVEIEMNIDGILDDNASIHGSTIQGIKVIGSLERWNEFDERTMFILAIGTYSNLLLRRNIVDRLNIPKDRFATLIHPKAEIMIPEIQIGSGSIIHANVAIHPLCFLGDFVVLSAGTIIGVNNIIGSYSLFAAGITTATNIRIGSSAFIGAGVTISPNIEIGCAAIVALGSVVFRNVENGYKVIGNPAKPYGKEELSEEFVKFANVDALELSNQKFN
jgi:sugar O-acyltransferase (sialic acid O-acetyltransferase NeuD family)